MSTMLEELKMLRKQLRRGKAVQTQDEVIVPKAEPDDDDLTEEEVDMSLGLEDQGIGQEFDVDAVLGKKFDENDNQFYLIRWKNWDGEPTWEPVENTECHQLIAAFEKRFEEKIKSNNAFNSHDDAGPVTNGTSDPKPRRYSKPTSARRTAVKQEPARARLSRNAKLTSTRI